MLPSLWIDSILRVALSLKRGDGGGKWPAQSLIRALSDGLAQ